MVMFKKKADFWKYFMSDRKELFFNHFNCDWILRDLTLKPKNGQLCFFGISWLLIFLVSATSGFVLFFPPLHESVLRLASDCLYLRNAATVRIFIPRNLSHPRWPHRRPSLHIGGWNVERFRAPFFRIPRFWNPCNTDFFEIEALRIRALWFTQADRIPARRGRIIHIWIFAFALSRLLSEPEIMQSGNIVIILTYSPKRMFRRRKNILDCIFLFASLPDCTEVHFSSLIYLRFCAVISAHFNKSQENLNIWWLYNFIFWIKPICPYCKVLPSPIFLLEMF